MKTRRAAGRRRDRRRADDGRRACRPRRCVTWPSLPLDANVQFMTVMATKMPYIGTGLSVHNGDRTGRKPAAREERGMTASTAGNASGEPLLAWLERRTANVARASWISTTRASSTGDCSARSGARSCWSSSRPAAASSARCRVRRRPDARHEGPGPGDDGHGHHLLHGHDLRGPPQPGRHAGLRGPRQLPLESEYPATSSPRSSAASWPPSS